MLAKYGAEAQRRDFDRIIANHDPLGVDLMWGVMNKRHGRNRSEVFRRGAERAVDYRFRKYPIRYCIKNTTCHE